MSHSSVWHIHRSQLGATTLSPSGPGNDDNEGVLHIPQSYKPGNSLSDCLMTYLIYSLGGGLTSQQRCSRFIPLPQPTWLKYYKRSCDFNFHCTDICYTFILFSLSFEILFLKSTFYSRLNGRKNIIQVITRWYNVLFLLGWAENFSGPTRNRFLITNGLIIRILKIYFFHVAGRNKLKAKL